MTMKLSTALLATLPRREFAALTDSGCINKGDLRTITALRAGDQTGETAKRRVFGAVKKQFSHADKQAQKLARGIYEYAKRQFEKQERTNPMTTATDLFEERVAKSRDTQRMLSDAITKYAAAHPGATRADCIDKILYSPEVKKMVQLELQLDKLTKAKNTLPQPGATTNIDFSQPGTRGRTGYDPSVADTHPKNQAAGENPTVRDHHQLLADIASGKVPYTDPKVSALVALERKRIFES
jgi:hypothetical protein